MHCRDPEVGSRCDSASPHSNPKDRRGNVSKHLHRSLGRTFGLLRVALREKCWIIEQTVKILGTKSVDENRRECVRGKLRESARSKEPLLSPTRCASGVKITIFPQVKFEFYFPICSGVGSSLRFGHRNKPRRRLGGNTKSRRIIPGGWDSEVEISRPDVNPRAHACVRVRIRSAASPVP